MRYCLLGSFLFVLTHITLAQSVQELVSQGSEAFNQRDHVTALYYLDRALSHEEWDAYSGKMDVFTKMAYIEESEGHFEEAARHYRDALRTLPDTDEENRLRLEQYYKTRYANTLDRSGYYQAAETIYWDLYEKADLSSKIQLIQRITENYAYQDITTQQMNRLHEEIVSLNINALGWGLADLYRIQGDYDKAYEIFDQIWRTTLPQAVDNYLALAEVYDQTERLDSLVEEIKANFSASPKSIELYLLLKGYQNQSEEALEELEHYLRLLQSGPAIDAGALVGAVENQLLVSWIEMIETNRSVEAATQKVRQIVDTNPMDLEWRKRLSNLYLKQDRQDQAVRLWLDWFQSDQSNPFQQLNAVEQIYRLGSTEKALELFERLEETIPPSLKHIEAKSALELGLYDQAISSFQIASISANVNPSGITNMILEHANTLVDPKPMMSLLVKAASGNAFDQTPVWLREALIESGVKYGLQEEINQMLGQDSSGQWKFYIAGAAQKYGRTDWARSLLESVPQESMLRHAAEENYIELIGDNPSIPSQREAADLLRPAIADIIDVTDSLDLSKGQQHKLFEYMDYRLNAFEPGEALKAIRLIESSTPYKQKKLSAAEKEHLFLNRARALTQLASFEPALALLDQIEQVPYRSQAEFLQAKIWLALKELEKADPILQSLVIDRSDWRMSNNALSYLVAMAPLVGEPMSEFFTLQSYLLQGRYKEAFPILRSLAVSQYETDTEDWARYQVGELKARMGDWEGAVDEWKRLLLEVEHPVYHGLIQYQFTRLPSEASGLVESASHRQELMAEFPDTLFSDLTRIETEERLKGLTP